MCGCAGLRTRCTRGGEKQLKAGKATQDSRADIHTGLHPIQFFLTFMYFESCNGIFLDMSGNNCNYGDFQGSRLTQKLPEMCPRDSI